MASARVALGMVELHLPDVDSLKGKRHVLKGLKERVRAQKIARRTGYIELTTFPGFQRRFALAMLFPQENLAGPTESAHG